MQELSISAVSNPKSNREVVGKFKPMTNSTYKVAMMRIIGLLRTSFLLKMRDLRVLSYKLKSNAISAGCGTFVS